MNVIDITGQTFGYLTVVERNGSINGAAAWRCKCKCGNEVTVKGDSLRRGTTQSCSYSCKRLLDARRTVGEKSGRLTVSSVVGTDKNKNYILECICDCGNIVRVKIHDFKSHHVSSCGCFQKDMASMSNKTHGLSKTKLYYVWVDMKGRCNRKTHHAYNCYGGRGISVCDEWTNNFMTFYHWAISNGYKEGLTIDRINNDGNYEPNNCRWTTMRTQCQNRRNIPKENRHCYKSVVMLSLNGEYEKSYESIKAACIDNNIKGTGTSISACCYGKQNYAYGHKWMFLNDYEANVKSYD